MTSINFSAIWSALLIILGLCLFEVVSSIDNAVINASVLAKIRNPRARKFFITWGMIIAVGAVRGILPFIIYYIPNSKLGFHEAVLGFWGGNPAVVQAVEQAAPLLLMAGGMFLVLLFLHWLLAEEKTIGFGFEYYLMKAGGVWFYATAGALLVVVLYVIKTYVTPAERATNLMLSAAVGIAVFFIADGFKEHAEAVEARLLEEHDTSSEALSDWSKVLFLEVIDTTFSTDGVVGAFAFTMIVPYILIGNGLGAYVVRQLTLGNVERLCSYDYLKNGAMYSIGLLGAAMTAEGFGVEVPSWVSPMVTFLCVGGFFWKSVRANRAKALKTVSA
jgi:uncharacterized protein